MVWDAVFLLSKRATTNSSGNIRRMLHTIIRKRYRELTVAWPPRYKKFMRSWTANPSRAEPRSSHEQANASSATDKRERENDSGAASAPDVIELVELFRFFSRARPVLSVVVIVAPPGSEAGGRSPSPSTPPILSSVRFACVPLFGEACSSFCPAWSAVRCSSKNGHASSLRW